jgi:arylsulfatase
MSRRRAVALLALSVLACGGGSNPDARPDLVLVSIDTLRPDRLVCYGGPPDVGTTLCGLARHGTRYAWAFSAAPFTAPSVASLLTARWSRDHGVRQEARWTLSSEVRTVAELLSEAGYATAAFVANPVLRRARGFARGFEVYDDRMTRPERNRPRMLEREAGELTDAALAWARVARRPRFLWVHYQDPHGPYEPPGAAPVEDRPGAVPLALLDDHSGWRGIPAYQALPGVRSLEAYSGRYLDEIRWLDRHLARLVSGLDALGPPPAILVTADHGEAFGEDEFYLAHGHSVGVDQIHVPLVYRPPGGGAPAEVTEPVSLVDVVPTLLAAAGVPIPGGLGGRPLPTRPDAKAPPRALFAEHPLRVAVVAGDVYYARDRMPLDGPVADAVTGGRLPPLPPRSTRLGADGRFAGYREDGAVAAALEPTLAPFLAEAPAAPGPAAPELDPSARESLRALGYLE